LFETIRAQKPRYTRDQLQAIQKSITNIDALVAEKALDFCLKHKLFSATDFSDAVEHFKNLLPLKELTWQDNSTKIKPLDETDRSKLKTKPQVRDVKLYQQLMERGNAC